ncbi:hypothetical protein CCR75_002842 [Bremia lactucae]|uniref:Uncharacterized protein n=1 Tax=Bremia lactucae TaxID=4779 RepID=A0A976ID97_BRELC|nr:hypothetical protein CCR75_002842 [Bremia lactucae]
MDGTDPFELADDPGVRDEALDVEKRRILEEVAKNGFEPTLMSEPKSACGTLSWHESSQPTVPAVS